MIVQGTPQWFAARCGRVTASRVADVIAKTKSGPSASRATYMGQLIAERLTQTVQQSFTNDAMRHGTETEPEARSAYVFRADVDVAEVGFIDHPAIVNTGASPDGLVGDDGMVEIKCPNTATHIDTLLGQAAPAKYVTQMQWQMACADRAWCDFVSYDPRMPANMALFIQRIDRDDAFIKATEAEVLAFLRELEEKVAALRTRYEPEALAA